MSRARYPLLFTMAVVVLTAATLVSYGGIGGLTRPVKMIGRWPGDSAPEHPPLVIPTRADYERVLRQRNALLRGGMRGPDALPTLEVFDVQLARAGSERQRG